MLYNIYDTRNTQLLVDKSVDIEASTAREALQTYLNNNGEGHLQFYNSSDNWVEWKTTPIIIENGQKYRNGRISWWGIKPIKIT